MNRRLALLGSIGIMGCTSPEIPATRPTGSVVVAMDFGKMKIRLQPLPPQRSDEMRSRQLSGNVAVQVVVDTTGTPVSATAVSGPKEFHPLAESWAMSWRFEPVLFNGNPQYARFTMTLPFR
jgi:hypothetical protein